MELSRYLKTRKIECAIVTCFVFLLCWLAASTGWLFSQCLTLFVGCIVAVMSQDDGFTDFAKSAMFVVLMTMILVFF